MINFLDSTCAQLNEEVATLQAAYYKDSKTNENLPVNDYSNFRLQMCLISWINKNQMSNVSYISILNTNIFSIHLYHHILIKIPNI